ncbi:Pentatricopeptide repeat-containing protein [Acorus gramineus]|uniref:Pentatricopeptide repeat-containing protein n=1 Tax=Acorus gramineus TaxID=55184 RepID=A0AAV9ADB9_ACOGR|nr:Pentatricopeptide repeat-containing protein [Acorus gramineus]
MLAFVNHGLKNNHRLSRLLSFSAAAAASSLPPPHLPPPPRRELVPPLSPFLPSSSTTDGLNTKLLADSFKEWFLTGSTISATPLTTVYDRIFAALAANEDGASLDAALGDLNLRLDESLVIGVLRHRPREVLLNLRFFDWAGRARGGSSYRHTRAAYNAIFHTLTRAGLFSVLLDWLGSFSAIGRAALAVSMSEKVRFHNTLAMGYAAAGKPDLALGIQARMRFNGHDLDAVAYHVLLNSLVEVGAFDVSEFVLRQIETRGLTTPATSGIKVKSLCKQGRLDEAKEYFIEVQNSKHKSRGRIAANLISALCKNDRFNEANALVEELGRLPDFPVSRAYEELLSNLIETQRTSTAIGFLKEKKETENFVPGIIEYNKLLFRLLNENRLEEVFDMLIEMHEQKISPDDITMNAALRFFCKAGMVDVARELYNARKDFGLSPNSVLYMHFINALCGEGNLDEACRVLDESIEHGYFPGRRTFGILTEALYRDGKLDKLSKLVDKALKQHIVPSGGVFGNYITALCKAGQTEEGYLLFPEKMRQSNVVLDGQVYSNLVTGFVKAKRGEKAARLLIEMQEKGYPPSQKLYKSVVCCLCEMGLLGHVLNLLEIQLVRNAGLNFGSKAEIYNCFIDGAGRAKQPMLSKEVFEKMVRSGVQPTSWSHVLLLRSYLHGGRFGDALTYFYDLRKERPPSMKLYNAFIIGLSQAGKPEQALVFWREAKEKGLILSLECYEELMFSLCNSYNYDAAVEVIRDFEATKRPVSSFLCNILIFHSHRSRDLWSAWVRSSMNDVEREGLHDAGRVSLGELVAAFSGGLRKKEHFENLDEMVERYFPVDIYTYNLLMKLLCMEGRMDDACDLFNRMWRKGYQPNRWSYDVIVHGFSKLDRKEEASMWIEEMHKKGFVPSWSTVDHYMNISNREG